MPQHYLTSDANSIETPRLFLHRPTSSDTPAFCQLWQSEQVRRYLGGPISLQLAEAKASANLALWQHLGFGPWAVIDKSSAQVFALCGISPSEYGPELSYMFSSAFWGRGLATEAVNAVLSHGFTLLNFPHTIAITQEANLSSCRLLERVGMVHTHNFWKWEATQRFYKINNPDVPSVDR